MSATQSTSAAASQGPIASTSAISSTSQVVETPSPTITISAPSSAVTHTAWAPPPLRMMDPMDERFGYTLALSSSRTHESRHDERRNSISIADVPPPYAEEAAIPLPEYTLHAPEPVTLAMFLFKFGFLFPLFWLFGAFILLSPLREPTFASTEDSTPAWMPEKTEAERKQIIATMREVETKWARRCLFAFLTFTALAATGGLAAWFIMHRS